MIRSVWVGGVIFILYYVPCTLKSSHTCLILVFVGPSYLSLIEVEFVTFVETITVRTYNCSCDMFCFKMMYDVQSYWVAVFGMCNIFAWTRWSAFLTVLFSCICSVPTHEFRDSDLKQAKAAVMSFPTERVCRGVVLLLDTVGSWFVSRLRDRPPEVFSLSFSCRCSQCGDRKRSLPEVCWSLFGRTGV
jgi:hypothetical protein